MTPGAFFAVGAVVMIALMLMGCARVDPCAQGCISTTVEHEAQHGI